MGTIFESKNSIANDFCANIMAYQQNNIVYFEREFIRNTMVGNRKRTNISRKLWKLGDFCRVTSRDSMKLTWDGGSKWQLNQLPVFQNYCEARAAAFLRYFESWDQYKVVQFLFLRYNSVFPATSGGNDVQVVRSSI